MRLTTSPAASNGIPDILNEANWGLMLYTNLQSTPNEPAGAVAFGTASDCGAGLGDQLRSGHLGLFARKRTTVGPAGLAAGVFMNYARLIKPYNAALSADFAGRGDAAYNAASSRQLHHSTSSTIAIQ